MKCVTVTDTRAPRRVSWPDMENRKTKTRRISELEVIIENDN